MHQLPSQVIAIAAKKSHELEESVKRKANSATPRRMLQDLYRSLRALNDDPTASGSQGTWTQVTQICTDLRKADAV